MGGKSELILISCAEVRGAGNINYSYVDKLQAGAELCQAQVNYMELLIVSSFQIQIESHSRVGAKVCKTRIRSHPLSNSRCFLAIVAYYDKINTMVIYRQQYYTSWCLRGKKRTN